MNGVGDEGEFGTTVDDAFLAGFDTWNELNQMQGPLLGSGSGQGSTGGGGAGVVGAGNGNGGGAGGERGMTAITGLGGSMNSFLGEAGLYGDNGSTGGADSFKDAFEEAGKDLSGKGFGGKDLESCKIGAFDPEQDPNDSEEEENDHELTHQASSGGTTTGMVTGQASPRGLGRIFGMGTHPVVAEAQARAEALVHGRGGKAGSTADAAEKKRKRAVLSKEERAKQNRDRNREHARNTRLRKKAFVEELKKQVEELVASRERDERERRAETRRDSSLRDMRLQVLMTFLEFRGRGEASRQAWQSVLDEQFEMRIPITPYRSFPPNQVQGGMRVIKGVDGVLADTASLALATRNACFGMRQVRSDTNGAVVGFQQQHQLADVKGRVATLVGGSGNPGVMRIKREASSSSVTSRTRSTGMTSSESCSGSEGDSRLASAAAVSASTSASGGGIGVGAGVGAMKSSRSGGVMGGSGVAATSNSSRVYYAVDPKDVMVNKNAFMCPFLARSPQVMVPGMLRCTFSTKSNRLSSLHMSFDPTVPARQLARASLLGRSTQEMASVMQGMLRGGGGSQGLATIAEDGSETPRALMGGIIGLKQDGGFAAQDEGVLHSILEDIREWRVSSTLVDDPIDGKSYLRVYPLSGETPGVNHFIGVLESLGVEQETRGPGGDMGVQSPTDVNVAEGIAHVGGVQGRVGEGGEDSSVRESGTSEGETSSDSASSAGRRDSMSGSRMSSGVGCRSSGSSGTDDGTGSRARSCRSLSAATTTGSDGGGSSAGSGPGSGYETRRSARRLANPSPSPTPTPTPPAASGSGTRGKARPEGAKRSRA